MLILKSLDIKIDKKYSTFAREVITECWASSSYTFLPNDSCCLLTMFREDYTVRDA